MELLFKLNKTVAAACGLKSGEQPSIAVECDLDLSGRFADGFFVALKDRLVTVTDGKAAVSVPTASIKRVDLDVGVGAGALTADTASGKVTLARFSMKHIDRFTAVRDELAKSFEPDSRGRDREIKESRCPKCGRPLVGGRCPSCCGKAASLGRFFDLCKPYIPKLIAVSLLMVVASACTLYTQQVQKVILDDFLRPMNGTARELLPFFAVLIALAAANILCTMGKSMLSAKLGAKMTSDLQTRIFNQVQSLSMSYITTSRAGEIMNRATSDTDSVREFMDHCFGNMLSNLITMVGAIILMSVINLKLALLTVAAAPILLILSRLFHRRVRTIYRAQWRYDDRIKSALHDVIQGIRVVKVFGREEAEGGKFAQMSDGLAKMNSRNEVFWAIFFPLLSFCMGLGINFIYLFGGVDVLNGSMTPGTLVQFAAYGSMLYMPLRWMAHMPRLIVNMLSSLDRIYSVLDEEPMITDSPTAVKHRIDGDVEFEHVSFGYNSYETVLRDICFTVKKGEMVGIVGESGVGKSSLINLLMRLYDVDSGSIRIDGIDLRELDISDFHSQLGVVLQETFLFAGTVLDNIRYSRPDASYEDVIRAAKTANAHDFICDMPDGYNTYIGERGYNVSGGQRQRIAIARAVLADPRLLILDEATSSLDTESEELVQQALTRLSEGRTTFAIAHRLSTLRSADRLVVLDRHTVAEIGTHDELMAKKGIYYGLITAQSRLHTVKPIENHSV